MSNGIDDPFEDPGPKRLDFKVWMNKKSGQLFEKWHSPFGDVITWEDLSIGDDKPCSECKLLFSDQYNRDHYEELGDL